MSNDTIDLGGVTAWQASPTSWTCWPPAAPRHRAPASASKAFNDAWTALTAAQVNLTSWAATMSALQAPATFSGSVSCTTSMQSGQTYNIPEVGGAILVDGRDVSAFTALGFAAVPSAQPTTGLRAGLVFWDAPANSYMRYDGSVWAAVTLT